MPGPSPLSLFAAWFGVYRNRRPWLIREQGVRKQYETGKKRYDAAVGLFIF
jgi:hypothetical protein